MENLKITDINNITLEECIEFNKLGLFFIVRDGKIKGFTRFND